MSEQLQLSITRLSNLKISLATHLDAVVENARWLSTLILAEMAAYIPPSLVQQ